MKRNITVIALSAMVFALWDSVGAQQTEKVARIGFLDTGTASGMAVLVDVFRQELNKLGWIEGKNIDIVFRFNEQGSSALA
jgi:hypothetical protein